LENIIITGIGQDGYYLAKKLLGKGFLVVGIDRWQDKGYSAEYKELMNNPNFVLVEGDITDKYLIRRLLERYKPKHFFNTAAISHVGVSFEIPERVTEVNYLAVIRMLEEIRSVSPLTSFLRCSTSEQWGGNTQTPHNEQSSMCPLSPYAVAKTAAFFITKLFRKYGLKTYNTLACNHESPMRPENFVTQKIVKALVEIKNGRTKPLLLGNMDAKRDWGYSEEYVEAMILIVESERPDDYVLATGETHSVREFVEETCAVLGLALEWQGKGVDEKGLVDGKPLVQISEDFYRPADVPVLCGDATKIKDALGWEPRIKFKELVKLMTDAEKQKKGGLQK